MADDQGVAMTLDLFLDMWVMKLELMPEFREVEAMNGVPTVGPEHYGELNDRRVQNVLRKLAGCMTEELYEALAELKNKPHRVEDRPTNPEAFDEEMGDFMMYFMEFLITADLTPARLHDMFFTAYEKCQERLNAGK